MKQVSFKILEGEKLLAKDIAKRAVALKLYPKKQQLDAWMDVVATHANGMPLRLGELRIADDFNFIHDIAGIRNCLDRQTGKLSNNFVPRFAR